MKQERRKTPRVLAEHLVSYVLLDEQGEAQEVGMARTLDLSKGGIVLEMSHPLDERSHLRVKMVSGDRILEAAGLVVYSTALPSDLWRVGVSFTEIGKEDLRVLAQEVHERGA